MSFAGHLSDVMLQIATATFKTMLWVPEFGWDATKETLAAEEPHAPQMLAAAQCFLAFFVKHIQRTWIHLAAEMQAGKTGVVTALIRLMLSNADKLKIRPNRIFVLTGMGDNAWKKQTRLRLPQCVRDNVHHSGGLAKVVMALRSLAAGGELSNVFIILDESHLAAAMNNRPSAIYAEVALLCPREKWQENNIRFLTISATDPAKVLMVKEKEDAQVVRLQTTEAYQSVEKLHTAARIRFAEEYGNLDSDKAITELKRCVTESFSDAPRYHLVRARYGKQDTIMEKLRVAFPDAEVLKFDSEEKITKRTAGGDDSSMALEAIEDINEKLEVEPEKHTFIVLKNMFYAAKTLEDEFVGVLYDRMGNKDDTNLQSLLGRACGYGKSSRTIIYTSKQTVENYLGCWRELCADPRFAPTLEGIPVSKIDKKMTGVRVRKVGGEVVFAPTSVVGPGVAAVATGGNTTKHDNCVVAVEEFATMDLLNSRWRAISGKDEKLRTPNRSEGDYVCSIGKKSEKQTASNVRAFITGSTKGWGSGLTAAADGDLVSRVYVGYENGVPIFFLRWTRKA
jgi:hypothetical protein